MSVKLHVAYSKFVGLFLTEGQQSIPEANMLSQASSKSYENLIWGRSIRIYVLTSQSCSFSLTFQNSHYYAGNFTVRLKLSI